MDKDPLLILVMCGICMAMGETNLFASGTTLSMKGNIPYEIDHLNGTALEIHLFYELLHKHEVTAAKMTADLMEINHRFEQDLESVFTETLNRNWNHSDVLIEFANTTQNSTVQFAIYNVLWSEIQNTKLKYNPFTILYLYENLQRVLVNTSSNEKFKNLEREIRNGFTTRCAQILEGAFYTKSIHNSRFPLQIQILDRLQELEDRFFDETLDNVYDAVNELMSPLEVAHSISNFTSITKQGVIANLKFLNRTNIGSSSQLESIIVINFQSLMTNYDFDKIPLPLRQQVVAFFPLSMRNLYGGASHVCLKNITGSDEYLYECPQTFLMCTNPRDIAKAAFKLELQPYQRFGFRSEFWSNRSIKLEGSTNQTNANVTKNVYSRADTTAFWFVEFSGDHVLLLDETRRFYLCAGNSSYWNDIEHHAYTRQAHQIQQYRHECLWLVEDCSKNATK